MKLFKEQMINTRPLTIINSERGERLTDTHKNYLFDLSYLGIIDLNGDKSIDFLQGQLTCDLNTVSDIQMAQGAQCNLKGRILSLMDIINWGGIKLILPADLIDATVTSLSKTAQLSKVALQQNAEYRVLGFYLQNVEDIVPDSIYLPQDLYALSYTSNYCYYHLGNGFYIIVIHKDKVSKFIKPFIELNQMMGSLAWHTLRLLHRQIEIYPESRGQFLPHRLGLHETNLISFNKGCYKGQEIIARTHYRATIKHEFRIYSINSQHNIYSGQKLFKIQEETEVGELIDYSCLGTNEYLIAVSILKETFSTARFEGSNEGTSLELLKFLG
jgi:folate-binding protein YgfZ